MLLTRSSLLRCLALIVVVSFVTLDVAPVFAQSGDVVVGQQQRRRTLFDILFGDDQPTSTPAPVTQPRSQPRQQAAPATPPPPPEVTKAADATRLAVFGDSLAVDLSRALERFYADDPNLVVIGKGVGSF